MISIADWGWPQFTYVVFTLVGIGVCANRTGKKKEGYYNFFSDFLGSIPVWVILLCGGFFA